MVEEKYISVLAKVMREQNRESDIMNELYHIVDEELFTYLAEVQFPGMPELSKRLEIILQYMRGLLVYPQVVGKEVVAIYGHYTNKLFSYIQNEVKEKNISWIKKNKTQIPILIVNSSQIEIEIVNNSFDKIKLSKEEYELLMSNSPQNGLAIYRLIKFIVFKLPLKRENTCYLLDNTYNELSEIYEEIICTKILSDELADVNLCNLNVYKGRKAIISFYDYLLYSVCPLTSYYSNSIRHLESMLRELKKDMVRNKGDELSHFNEELKGRLHRYTKEKNSIDEILMKLVNEVKKIDQLYEDTRNGEDKCLTKYLKDCMFMYFFANEGINKECARDCMKRLWDYGYGYQDMLIKYSKSLNGNKTTVPDKHFSKDQEWEIAKILIHFSQESEITDEIASMIACLGRERLTTGKEWYYWSLINNDEESLKNAAELGCDMACKKLFKETYSDQYVKDLLKSVLYPEACMEQGIMDVGNGDGIVSISDKRLAYLKIATAMGDNRGAMTIADVLYDNVIWQYFSTKGKPMKKMKDNKLLEEYLSVLGLCEFLVSKKIDVAKNKERIAIINFCINRDMSLVHSCFYNKGGAAAHYCKGYLAEYGLYDSKDLDKALKCYEKVKVSEIPAVKNAKNRVKNKIVTREKNKEDEYDDDNDYRGYSYSSYSGSSSWCFITTAASCAIKKGRDCDELNFLRKFRDEHIRNTPEGKALVEEYYNIAPKIIECIDKEENAIDIYADLWTDYIVPSVKEICQGNWQNAQDIYVMMVVDLSKKYGVGINTAGYEELYMSTLKRVGYIE